MKKILNMEQPGFCLECSHQSPGHFLECSKFEKPDDEEYIQLLSEELQKLIQSLEQENYKGFATDAHKRIGKIEEELVKILSKHSGGGDEDDWLKEVKEMSERYKHHDSGIKFQSAGVGQAKKRDVKTEQQEASRPEKEKLNEAQERIKNIFLDKIKRACDFNTNGGKESLFTMLGETKSVSKHVEELLKQEVGEVLKGNVSDLWRKQVEKHRSNFSNTLIEGMGEVLYGKTLAELKRGQTIMDRTTKNEANVRLGNGQMVIDHVAKNLEEYFPHIFPRKESADESAKDIAVLRMMIEDTRAEYFMRNRFSSVIVSNSAKNERDMTQAFEKFFNDKLIGATFIKRRAFIYFYRNLNTVFPGIDSKKKEIIKKSLLVCLSKDELFGD